jgi:hypothetical protein
MASEQAAQDRSLGVWGSRTYGWSGEERQRAAGFPIDPAGRQRVLGFPPDPFETARGDWHRAFACAARRCERLKTRWLP